VLGFLLARAFGRSSTIKFPRTPGGTRLGTLLLIYKEKEPPMFARILYFEVKPEKKEELVRAVKNQVVPILKQQVGFLEILPFFPEKAREGKAVNISLWSTKSDAERYERETYARVADILKPYLTAPVVVNHYNLETTICEHFVTALTA
jgi:quinol monooxygenase YgiN